MWDLATIVELNLIAANAVESGQQQREALLGILAEGGRPTKYLPVNQECGCNSVVE